MFQLCHVKTRSKPGLITKVTEMSRSSIQNVSWIWINEKVNSQFYLKIDFLYSYTCDETREPPLCIVWNVFVANLKPLKQVLSAHFSYLVLFSREMKLKVVLKFDWTVHASHTYLTMLDLICFIFKWKAIRIVSHSVITFMNYGHPNFVF